MGLRGEYVYVASQFRRSGRGIRRASAFNFASFRRRDMHGRVMRARRLGGARGVIFLMSASVESVLEAFGDSLAGGAIAALKNDIHLVISRESRLTMDT